MRHRTSSSLVLVLVLALIPLTAGSVHAQRRRARRVRPVRPVVVAPLYSRSPWYSPWYSSWYGPWYGPGPFYGSYDPSASLRIQARPRQTEVYVDGAFAGLVDNFDGVFQRLRVIPGQHEIALYLEGFRTEIRSLYLAPRSGYTIRHDMIPLPPGEPAEPRPTMRAPFPAGPTASPRTPAYLPPRSPDAVGPRDEAPAGLGTLQLRIQPPGADVRIDGEPWSGPADGEPLIVQVGEGRHVIEIRRDGYRPLTTEVEVPPGATVPVNVSLTPQ